MLQTKHWPAGVSITPRNNNVQYNLEDVNGAGSVAFTRRTVPRSKEGELFARLGRDYILVKKRHEIDMVSNRDFISSVHRKINAE